MADWGSITPKQRNRTTDLRDFVDLVEFVDKGPYKVLRGIGPTWSYAVHWYEAVSQAGNSYKTMRVCLNYNVLTGNFDGEFCPYCAADADDEPTVYYMSNFIDRDLESGEPMRKATPQPEEMKPAILGPTNVKDPFKCFLKTKGSQTWTPVRVFRTTSANAIKLKNFTELNTRIDKQNNRKLKFPINHLQYGMDISIKYDKSLAFSLRYDIQRDQPSAITPKERKFHLWRLDVIKPATPEVAVKEWNWLKDRLKKVLKSTEAESPVVEDGNTAYDSAYYGGGYDDSDMEVVVPDIGLASGTLQADDLPWNTPQQQIKQQSKAQPQVKSNLSVGIIGKAKIGNSVLPARVDAVSGDRLKVTLRDGRKGVINRADFFN